MAKCLVGVAGGISANDKGKLIPENIRAGVTIAKVTGTLTWQDLLPETMIVQAGNTIDDFVGGGIVKYGDVGFLRVGSTGIVWTCQQNNATAIFSKEINTEDWQAVEFDISLTRYNSSTRCKFGVGSNANGDTGWVAYKQFNDTTFSRTTIRVDIPMGGTTFVKGWCNWVSNVTLYKTTLIKRQ